MQKIPLTKGKYALVDDEDFEALNRHKWYYSQGYAMRDEWLGSSKKKHLQMHRVIMDTPAGNDTDHLNRDKLDNRRENLRVCTRSQNSVNKGIQKNSTTGFKGVHFFKRTGKWMSYVHLDKKRVYLGYFASPEAAATAYNKAVSEHYGEFALLNTV